MHFTVDKLKKDLDAEWKRAQQLTYNVIELEERRQQIENEKIRLAEEKHTLVHRMEDLPARVYRRRSLGDTL